jgi:putative Ca2+/H+ antiporter (TMEM165/GDT1 family)
LSHGLTFGSIALLAFWTVLVAELVGDKSLYTLTSLTLRFRAGLVFSAFALASGAKMLVAVLLGSALVQLPSHRTSIVSAGAFFVSAVLIWMEGSPTGSDGELKQTTWTKGTLACFASFFLTEWGDPGQISAAALVLKSHLLTATWLGGTLAMTIKGVVAMTIGIHLRDRLPRRTLRLVASASCCVLGILTLGESALA